MDLIGPMPETPRGNKYIVTLTDYFSKWAEAAPLPDKTALGIAKFIFSVSFLTTLGQYMAWEINHECAVKLELTQLVYTCLGHVQNGLSRDPNYWSGSWVREWPLYSTVCNHQHWASDHQCLPPTGMLMLVVYLVDQHELIVILVLVCTSLGLTRF